MIDLSNLSADEFVDGIRRNDKVILSRAITLLESQAPSHRDKAWKILESCFPAGDHSIRIGITGPPGAGKSTFIEALGKIISDEGKKIAIVAIDPTSKKHKGSILGDKTRMQELSRMEQVYIRPSASGPAGGGVNAHTREVTLVLEAAGYDVILIETVGVGQGETAVYDLCDLFFLLTIAGAGDELQGIKRGVMEMADIIAVNKDDGENRGRVKTATAELKQALSLFPLPESGIAPSVIACSALEGGNISNVWKLITDFVASSRKSGHFMSRRNQQLKTWMHEILYNELLGHLYASEDYKSALSLAEREIEKGNLQPLFAIRRQIGEMLP